MTSKGGRKRVNPQIRTKIAQIGINLYNWRIEHRMTKRQLAIRLANNDPDERSHHTWRDALIRIENGDGGMSVAMLLALSQAAKIKLEQLLHGCD
jgi:transcriptional regulator with XRE-family HTH domain